MTSTRKESTQRAVDTNVQLDDLDVFVRVIEGRSMSAAARVLGVPKSTVSRAISRLEDGLRVRLIQRTSRVLAPTDAGQALYDETRPHVLALRAASNVVSESVEVPSGRCASRPPMRSARTSWPMHSRAFASSIRSFTSMSCSRHAPSTS